MKTGGRRNFGYGRSIQYAARNVLWDRFGDGRYGTRHSHEARLKPFLAWVNRWLDEGFAPVRKAWLNHAAHKGEEIEVRLHDEILKGVFDDLDEEGHLLLKLADGETRKISAGDVYF